MVFVSKWLFMENARLLDYSFLKKSQGLQRPYRLLAYFLLALTVLALIGVIVYFVLPASTDASSASARGVVVTNGLACDAIGAGILAKGGTAVEAAIAALFCEGVSMPQAMGLGGGFLMTIFHKQTNTVYSLNSRESAPAAASELMFQGRSSLKGGLSVAIPAELKGYWEAYNKFPAKLKWRELVQPTIDLCKKGVLVTDYLAGVFEKQVSQLRKDPFLRDAFLDPVTKEPLKTNQRIMRPELIETLEVIAAQGGDCLHNGSLTKRFVEDIQAAGGIITEDDMKNYKPQWQVPIKIRMAHKEVLYTSPVPGSGLVLGFIMNLLNGFLDHTAPSSVQNWQRIIETFKHAYGRRTELGDINLDELIKQLTSPLFAGEMRKKINDTSTSQDPVFYGGNTTMPEDHGTAHISILAPNGDAVSVTSTINQYFGAGFVSKSTGIILNDEMDDFGSPNKTNEFNIPPSVANYISPGKRPLSSMCPSIVVGADGEVKMVIGGAGGTKITTSVALIMIRHLWYNISLRTSIADKRLHHQLYPMKISFEDEYQSEQALVNALHQIGHEYEMKPATGFSAVTAISRKDGSLFPATDTRRPGYFSWVD